MRFMILPASKPENTLLVKVPEDYAVEEAFRYVTGVIGEMEEKNKAFTHEDIADVLDEHGFELQDYILGPSWE